MAWTSADTNAELGAPTREQAAFDARAKAVEDIVREMRLITQIGPRWPSKTGDAISRMSDLAMDLQREISRLSIDGCRPGEPTGPLVSPNQITTPIAQVKVGAQ